jgi:hypothetical protein
VGVVRTKIGPAFTPKNFKKVVIRGFVKKDLSYGEELLLTLEGRRLIRKHDVSKAESQ